MKMLVTKMAVAASVGLASLIAGGAASAQAHRQQAAPQVYNDQGNQRSLGPRVTVQPNDVIKGDKLIGRDPDPFIRGEILRHSDSGWPD